MDFIRDFQNSKKKFKTEFNKCKEDVVYFVENHLKVSYPDNDRNIQLYPCQKGALYNFEDNDRFILNSCRQGGKSILSVGFVLWSALFHENKSVGVMNLSQSMSDSYRRIIQNNMCGVDLVQNNRNRITFENGSSITFLTDTHNSYSLCGRSFDLLDLQDFAFYNSQKRVLQYVYPQISRKKGNKLIISSTKNQEDDLFYNLYVNSKYPESEWKSQAINWWDVPGRDRKWEKGMRKNISPDHFEREFKADF